MALVWPGTPQFIAGHRKIGAVAMTAWVALVTASVVIVLFAHPTAGDFVDLVANSGTFFVLRLLLGLVAFAWLALFVDAWRIALGAGMDWLRVGTVSLANVVVIALLTGVATVGWDAISASRTVVTQVFNHTATSAPLQGRYNILLIGADSGNDRTGLRPDSMSVASIDASTGKTILIGLPRNLENFPFAPSSPMRKIYPTTYSNCGEVGGCLLNTVYLEGQEHASLYPGVDDPGLQATSEAIEGITGLTINYYIIINMQGLVNLVDATGGVTMTINSPIAMFGHDEVAKWGKNPSMYIPAGTIKLNGQQALWYGRSRVQSDDYTRMARQKCLLNAMLHQLSPQTVLVNASDIAKSGAAMLQTNIPASELDSFANLAVKSRSVPIMSLGLAPPTYDPVNLPVQKIKRDIADLIAQSEAPPTTAAPAPSSGAQSPSVVAPTPAAPTGSAPLGANDTTDLNASCG